MVSGGRVLRNESAPSDEDVLAAALVAGLAAEINCSTEVAGHQNVAIAVNSDRARCIFAIAAHFIARTAKSSRPKVHATWRVLRNENVRRTESGHRSATEVRGACERPYHDHIAAAVNRNAITTVTAT